MRARFSSTFQSLQVRNFRLFAIGTLIRSLGVWMMFIAQDWLVLDLSDNSATALGVVTALQFVPVLLLTLLSGRLADRYDKRHLLFIANGAWAVLVADHGRARADRRGAAVAHLRVRRPAGHHHRDRAAGTPGVRVRDGRRHAAAQRARLVGGDVQHRPGRRPGDRRRRHRPPRRRADLPDQRARRSGATVLPGPHAHRRAAPGKPAAAGRARLRTRGRRPPVRLAPPRPGSADGARLDHRDVGVQLPAHARRAREDGVPHRRRLVRPVHQRAGGGRARRSAGRRRPAARGRRSTW